jgi:hypothetical protein
MGLIFGALIVEHDRSFDQADGFGEPLSSRGDHAEQEMGIGVFGVVGQHAQAALLCVSQAAAVQVLLRLAMALPDFMSEVRISF